MLFTFLNPLIYCQTLFGEKNGIVSFDQSTHGPKGAIIEDLDQDGDLDVIALGSSNNSLVFFENEDGFGQFGHKKIIAETPNFPKELVSGDIDNDGDIDLVVLPKVAGEVV